MDKKAVIGYDTDDYRIWSRNGGLIQSRDVGFHERPISSNVGDVTLPNIELNQSGNENIEPSKED